MNDLVYIPKYIQQQSDLNYGEAVTHENYNEKINLNTDQGDYNTSVLDILLNSQEGEPTYRISYLDADLNAFKEEIRAADVDYVERMEALEEGFEVVESGYSNWVSTNANRFQNIETQASNIINGVIKVGKATEADGLAGVTTAGARKYYGTDKTNAIGFHPVAPPIFAEEFNGAADIDGVYYIPAIDTVSEAMLTPVLRDKLNREVIIVTDYDELSSRPSIANVTLTGSKSLADLGIQPVGNYLTSIPSTYVVRTELEPYYKTTDAQSWVNTRLSSYATTATVSGVSTVANNAANDLASYKPYVEGRHARVQIGSSWNYAAGGPKYGDILVTF